MKNDDRDILWKLFMVAWPGVTVLPKERPPLVDVKKYILKAHNEFKPSNPSSVFIILCGRLEDQVASPLGHVTVLNEWKTREIIPKVYGTLIARGETHVLEVNSPKVKDMVYFDVLSALQRLQDDIVARLVINRSATIRQRVIYYSRTKPELNTPTKMAQYIGCSREMASREMTRLGCKEKKQ